MKLGIVLVVLGATDVILTLIGRVWTGAPVRLVIDVALITWGISRIKSHHQP